ncbi:MAG: ASCH domain-containing protein [Dehalogenimonas sp.]
MKVLLSIKPEYAEKIFDGSKTYEYRRAIFDAERVTTVVVYASAPVQRVIGEFEIEHIIQDEPRTLWERTGAHGGISQEGFQQYFSDKANGYAIKVKEAKRYKVPAKLESFSISFPPQSFTYLA